LREKTTVARSIDIQGASTKKSLYIAIQGLKCRTSNNESQNNDIIQSIFTTHVKIQSNTVDLEPAPQ